MLFLDAETELIAPCNQVPRLVAFGVERDGAYLPVKWDSPEALLWVEAGLAEGLCGQHVAFDLLVFCRRWPHLLPRVFEAYRAGRIFDTMLRQKLIEIALGEKRDDGGTGYGLDQVALRSIGQKVDKTDPWRLRYGELYDVPLAEWPEGALAYLRRDVVVLRPIFEWQERWRSEGFLEDEHRQAMHDFALTLATARGVEVDQAKVDALEAAIRGEHASLEKNLVGWGLLSTKRKRDVDKRTGYPLPGVELKRNMALVKRYLDTIPDHPRTDPSKSYPNGQAKTDETSLEETGHPHLEALGRYGVLNAVMSKDIPLLRRGVIHSSFDSLVNTGRSSSYDPNLQNIKVLLFVWWLCGMCVAHGQDAAEAKSHIKKTEHPVTIVSHGIRECFRPRPGFVFISCDFGGLELATWARVCLDLLGQSRMASMLIERVDPHLVMASNLIGETYEWCDANKKDGGRGYQARQTGKVGNFGLPGGLGWRSLIKYAKGNYKVILDEGQARHTIAAWKHTYPEHRPYFDLIHRLTSGSDGKGTIRQVRSNRIRGGCYYTKAANSFFQGLGGDIAKAALFDVQEACYTQPRSPLYGSRPWGFVHDEILAEAPVHCASEAADELSRVMVKAAEPWLEEIPIKAEPTVHWIWSKAAESKRGPDGRLSVWAG